MPLIYCQQKVHSVYNIVQIGGIMASFDIYCLLASFSLVVFYF